MPVKPVDFCTKTLELAEANGWKVKELVKAPFPPDQSRYMISRGEVALVAYFSITLNFCYAILRDDTINRYVVLEQILTAPEDSVTVVTNPGELTGFTVRHEAPNQTDENGVYPVDEPGFNWPTLITTADHVTAQRYSTETTEWYTVGSAMANRETRRWHVRSVALGEIAVVGSYGMNERDMRRAVVAILREMC